MREGKPVVWAYLAFLIICYITLYTQSIIADRDYYHITATEQAELIAEQQETIVKLELILKYLTGYTVDESDNSPIHHNRSPRRPNKDPI